MALTPNQKVRLAALVARDLRSRGADTVEKATLLFLSFIEANRMQQKTYLTGLIADKQAENTATSESLPDSITEKQNALAAENTTLDDLDAEIDNLS